MSFRIKKKNASTEPATSAHQVSLAPFTEMASKTFINVTLVSIAVRLFQMGFSYLMALLALLNMLRMPKDSQYPESEHYTSFERTSPNKNSLFPSISNTVMENNATVENDPPTLEYDSSSGSCPQPCSTGLTTRLLPFKNDKGEIEWGFSDEITPGTELDVFKMNDVPHKRLRELDEEDAADNEEDDDDDINLSPTVSNSSSNNESILSANHKQLHKKKHIEDSPLTNHSSPLTPGHHDKLAHITSPSSSENITDLAGDDLSGDDKVHQCPHCDAVFKIRGYLTRHLKKHAVKKAYSCPFHKYSVYIDENNITHKCHPNGGFSRRDTYKTHLKSRHFKYPKGTKTKSRANSSGTCSMCGEHFPNAEIWCEIHVEGGECKYLPPGFKGKSRIKNRIKKQLTKEQLKEFEQNGCPVPLHHPYAMSAFNKNDLSTIYAENSPNSCSATPAPAFQNSLAYDYQQSSHSPASSVTSSINGIHPTNRIVSKSPLNMSNTARSQPMQLPGPYSQYAHENIHSAPPQFEQFQHSNTSYKHIEREDYDDEFCLDIDQLNNSSFNNVNEIATM